VAWISYLRWGGAVCVRSGRARCRSWSVPGREALSGPRGRACRPARDRPMLSDRKRSPLATRRRHPPAWAGRWSPAAVRPPRRTANGSRPRAPWARLTTIPVPRRPVKAGSLTVTARGQHRPPGRTTPGSTVRRPVVFLVRGTLPGSPGSAADRTAPGAWW